MKLKDWLGKKFTKEEQGSLINLDCSGEGISSLEGIEVLVKLTHLHCYDNELTSLKGIEHLVNLEFLYCSKNELTSLKGIENLTNLKKLYCHDNPLSYPDLFNFSKIKLEVKKEIRQYKINKLLLL